VHTFGEPAGVKQQGGVFEIVTREVEIECLPVDIPTEFKVDVSDLMLGKQLRAGELTMDSAKMKLVTDPDRVLAHVVALRVEEEKPVEAVAAEAATPAEPEVIKKGKKEVEGEEGAEAEAKPEKGEKAEKGEKKK
jgi:large subunit ribosomal protein L25